MMSDYLIKRDLAILAAEQEITRVFEGDNPLDHESMDKPRHFNLDDLKAVPMEAVIAAMFC